MTVTWGLRKLYWDNNSRGEGSFDGDISTEAVEINCGELHGAGKEERQGSA